MASICTLRSMYSLIHCTLQPAPSKWGAHFITTHVAVYAVAAIATIASRLST